MSTPEDRIRFIIHRSKVVLLADLSHCSPQELDKFAKLVPTFVTKEPKASVLLLADFTGSTFDRKHMEQLKVALVRDRPHLKRSAWVGTEGLPHIFYENMRTFAQRDLPTFSNRDEALDWLVRDE